MSGLTRVHSVATGPEEVVSNHAEREKVLGDVTWVVVRM